MENIWGKTNIGGSSNENNNNNNNNNNSSVFGSLTNNTTTSTSTPLSSVFGSSNTTSAFGNVAAGSTDNNNNSNSNSAFTISSLNPSAPSFIPSTNRGGFFAPPQQQIQQPQQQQQQQTQTQAQAQQNVLFVGNIPFGSTGGNEALITAEIRNHFSQFGTVESISELKKIPNNTFTLKLVYSKNGEASEAIKRGKKYNNTILVIKPHKFPNTSKPKPQPQSNTTTASSSTTSLTSPSPFTSKGNNYNDLSTILKKDDDLMLRSQERNLRFQLMKNSALSPQISSPTTPTFTNSNQHDNDDNDGEEGEFEEEEQQEQGEEELEEGEGEEEFEISSSPPIISASTTTTNTTDTNITNPTTIINNSGIDHKIGLCFDFIPKKERAHRESSGDINILERSPLNYDQVKLIKKYKRNVADDVTEIPPEEIRPVYVLLKVMDYITSEIVDQEQLQRPGVSFAEIQNFVRDRTRSLRQDLTSQHSKDGISIDIHERCTRFHIVSHHYLCEYLDKDFNAFQNREQLNNCLTSLKQFYNDHLKNTNGLIAKNEPEFRSYYILNNLENNVDLVSYMIDIPRIIFHHPFIQYAIEVWKAYRSDNYCRFFMLTLSGTYLQQCLLHRYFTNVRKIAIKRIARSYRAPNSSTTMFPVSDFNSILMFSDNSETIHFLDGIAGISLENDQIVVTKNSFSVKSIDEINITPKKSPIIMSKAPGGGIGSSNSFQLTIDQPEPVPVAKYRKCFIDFDQSYLPSPQIYSNLCLKQESQQSQIISHQAASGPMKDLTTKNAMAFAISNKVTSITTPPVPTPSIAKSTILSPSQSISRVQSLPISKLPPSNIIGSDNNKTSTTTPITTPTTTPIKVNIPPTTPTTTVNAPTTPTSSLFSNKISNFGVGINNAINPSVVISPSIFDKPTTTTSTSTAAATTSTIPPISTIFGVSQQLPSTSTPTSTTNVKSIFGVEQKPSSSISPPTTTTATSDTKSIFGVTSTTPPSIFSPSTQTPPSIFSSPTLQQPTTAISKPPATTTTTTTITLSSSLLFQPTPPTTTSKPDISNGSSIFGKDVTPANAFTIPAVPIKSPPSFNTSTTQQPPLKLDGMFGGSAITTPQRTATGSATNKQQDIAHTPMSVLVGSKSNSTSAPLFSNDDYQNSPMPISTIKQPIQQQQLPPSHLQSISSPMTLSTPYVNLNSSQSSLSLKQKPTIPFPVDQIVNEQKQKQQQKEQKEQPLPIVVKKPKANKKSYEEKSNDALLSYMFRSWKFQVLHYQNQQKQLQSIGNKVTTFDNMNNGYFSQPQPQQLITPKQQNTITTSTSSSSQIRPQRQLNSNIKIDLSPINIPYYIYQHLDKINKMNQKNQPLVWKLIYSCPPPTPSENNNLKQFVDVISHRLSFERNIKNIKDEDTLCLVQKYHIEYQSGSVDNSQTADRSIGVVVKRVVNNQQFLSNQRGVSSILLQISKSIGFDENCKSQLFTIMKSTQIEDSTQRIPILFLVVNDCLVNQSDEVDSMVYENIENSIGSFINSNSTLWNQVIVSSKVIVVDEIESIVNSDSSNNSLVYSIKWLSSNSPPIPFTEIRPLTSVLDSVILSKFSTIFKSFYNQQQTPKLYNQSQLLSQSPQSLSAPQSIVNYFNNTINQLIQFITNPALKSIQWPIPEFSTSSSSSSSTYWNSDSTFNSIKSSLKSILLNDLPNDLKNLIGTTSKLINGSSNGSGGINEHYESIEPIIKSCFQWVSSHQQDKIDNINIENQIREIFLNHFISKFDKYNNSSSDGGQYFIVIPWNLIFESVFSYQICKIPFISSFFSDPLITDLPNFKNQDNQKLKVITLPVKQQQPQQITSNTTTSSPLKRRQSDHQHHDNNNHKYHKVHFDEMELDELKSNDNNPIKRKQQIVNNNSDNGDNSLYSISGSGSNGFNSSSLILNSQIQLNKSLIEKKQSTSRVLDQLLSSLKNEKRIERSTTKSLVSTYNNNLKNQQQLTTSNYNHNSLTTSNIVFKNQRLTGSIADISEKLLSIIENENEI